MEAKTFKAEPSTKCAAVYQCAHPNGAGLMSFSRRKLAIKLWYCIGDGTITDIWNNKEAKTAFTVSEKEDKTICVPKSPSFRSEIANETKKDAHKRYHKNITHKIHICHTALHIHTNKNM